MKFDRFLMIAGVKKAGKGVLASLLDGHDGVFVVPAWHDKLVAAHVNEPFFRGAVELGTLSHIDVYHRTVLSKSDWHTLKVFALSKSLTMALSSVKALAVPFDLDFWKLERTVFEQMSKIPGASFTSENALDVLVKNICRSILPARMSALERGGYFVSMATNDFIKYEEYFAQYPASKAIFIQRNRMEWIYSTINQWCANDKQLVSRRIKNMISGGDVLYAEICKIFENMSAVEGIREKYPERFLIIQFNDVMLNTNVTINRIADFLGIEKQKALYSSTVLGTKIDAISQIVEPEEAIPLEHKDLLRIFIDIMRQETATKVEQKKARINKIKKEVLKIFPYFLVHRRIDSP